MRLLFLCAANAARSQMAEGLARQMLGPGAVVQSAGSRPQTVSPEVLTVLREVGAETTGLVAKGIDSIDPARVDLVITLCDELACPPSFAGSRHLHWPLVDPLAASGTADDRLGAFRRIRDQLRHRLGTLRSIHQG